MKHTRIPISIALIIFLLIAPDSFAAARNNPRSVKQCPVRSGTPTLSEAADLPGYDKAIAEFLNSGGKTTDLLAILIEREQISPRRNEKIGPIEPWYSNHGGVEVADFNGDALLDVAVSLYDPNHFDGGLYIYICDGEQYQQIPSPVGIAKFVRTGELKRPNRAPKFIYTGDMNRDGRAELVYDIGTSGASTISFDIQIVGWDEAHHVMYSLFDGEIVFAASGGFSKVVNASNGVRALVLRTGFSGSGIAAGPQRQYTITYTWNGKQFVEASNVGDPPKDRLHAAYDAVAALNRQDLGKAIWLYDRVQRDEKLDDWNPETQIALTAHATYGLVISHAKHSGLTSPNTLNAYRNMQRISSLHSLQDKLWLKYGEIFWQSTQSSKDLHRACQAVNQAIQVDIAALPGNGPGGIQQLGIWPWFTYNVNWIPTERGLSFCPF